jgi:hypothetical protein
VQSQTRSSLAAAGGPRRRTAALACLVVSTLTLAACGSGGSSDSTATQAATPPASTTHPAGPRTQSIDENGQLTLDHSPGLGNYYEKGAITGTFAGTMSLHAQLEASGLAVSFTAKLPGGSVSGKGRAIVSITGAATAPLKGTASIMRGTGRYANAHGSGLRVVGTTALDGSKATVHLTGTVTY